MLEVSGRVGVIFHMLYPEAASRQLKKLLALDKEEPWKTKSMTKDWVSHGLVDINWHGS